MRNLLKSIIPFLKPTKLVFTAFMFWACTSLATAATVPAANFLMPDGTLNAFAIDNQQFNLDLAGWNVTLDPERGPVFNPAPVLLPNTWSALDRGLAGGTGITVSVIALIDGIFYVGGRFTGVGSGGTAVTGLNNIARWNGTAWSAMGMGLNDAVRGIVKIGTDIYVGGTFTGVGSGGTAVTGLNRVARWNGTAWFALGQGLNGFAVNTVAASGNDFYVGGNFSDVGGGTSVPGLNNIARWNGSTWSALGTGFNNFVLTITVSGSDVYVGGLFTNVSGTTAASALNYIARWNGSAWLPLDRGLNSLVNTIVVRGTDIYVGGNFTDVGANGTPATAIFRIARWNGSAWFSVGGGLNGEVRSIAFVGNDLYAGGFIDGAYTPPTSLNRIVRLDGTTWSNLDGGLNNVVNTIAVNGNDVYAGGTFTGVGSGGAAVTGLNRIAKWEAACTPSVSIAANPAGSITAGTSVTFTATPTNGGTPSYQWKKNGNNVGTNSATYTDAALANNDKITCVLTSNAACASPTTATSNEITMTVSCATPIAYNVTGRGSCGSVTVFLSNSESGVTYQLKKDNVNDGSVVNGDTGRAISFGTKTDPGIYTIVATRTAGACTNNMTGSVTVIITPTPSVSIAANPTGSITSGTSVTFTATPTNGGSTPAYQWKKNGNNAGNNSATYTDAALANNDKITCVLTSNATCASPTTATSNEITMTVTAACTCDPTCSPIPTAANTYTASQAVLNATSGYTHYCDASNNLLLSLKVPSGMTIPAAAVKIKVGATAATFYARLCGAATASNACFMDRVGGSALINRFWHIDQALVTGGTVSLTNQLSVASYFMESDYTALNTALTNNAQAALTNKTQLRLYQPRSNLNFGAFPDPSAVVPQLSVNRHSHGTTPGTAAWLLSTPQPTINMAEFKLSSIRNSGGIGLH